MKVRSALVGVLVGLTVVPAAAFKVGFTYEDGSDAIFEHDLNTREVFEATISGELEWAGAKGSAMDVADLKGLAHPLYPNGSPQVDYICGWVKGIGEVTGREFKRFYYVRSGPHATIVDMANDYHVKMLKDRGCGQVLGL
ncbi:hypothetical protein [Mesorhizobium sp. A556]